MSANNNITRDLPKANIQSMIFLIISYPSLLLFYLAHSIKFFYSEELKLSHENQFSIVHCIMNLKLANLFHNLSYKKWFSKIFFNLFFWKIYFLYCWKWRPAPYRFSAHFGNAWVNRGAQRCTRYNLLLVCVHKISSQLHLRHDI